MSSFAGKTAIVTGGASGIGERVAEDIVAKGGNVVVGDVNGDLGKKLSSRLGATKAKFVELDISQSSDCEQAVEAAQSAFGGFDFLVNCAIAMNAKPLMELSEAGWRKTLDVGLTGTFLMSRAFADGLVRQKSDSEHFLYRRSASLRRGRCVQHGQGRPHPFDRANGNRVGAV
jgi:NAD(P)-dependent dehydrogenase (short-subunit alcohol dehydrogenase family)